MISGLPPQPLLVSRLTALHIACRYGYLEVVKTLVQYHNSNSNNSNNANSSLMISATDHLGDTPLNVALENKKLDVVRYLLSDEFKSEIKIDVNIADNVRCPSIIPQFQLLLFKSIYDVLSG